MDDIEVMFQMNKAGAYVPSVETEKAVMEVRCQLIPGRVCCGVG
jgi:hypothetical protein